MSLTIESAYASMCKVLHDYYLRFEIDDLGSLLGDMSPTIWTNQKPIDSSMMEDWIRVLENREFINPHRCYSAMIQFLRLQKKEFVFDFGKLFQILEEEKEEIIQQFFGSD